MSPEEQIVNQGDHVRIRPSGPTEWEYIIGLLKKAARTASDGDVRNYLIDVRGTKIGLNIVDQYRIAYDQGEKMGFSSDSRFAILVDEGDRSRDFVEIAVNKAGYSCRIFEDESKAVDWFNR